MIEELNWFALLTRSNFEKTVYTSIKAKKFEVFLPMTKKKSRRRDRNLMIETPLFPGYLFVKTSFESSDQLNILKTVGVARILGNKSGPVPVPKSQISSLKILTDSDTDFVTGSNRSLHKGSSVMIMEGPMTGVTGEFSRYKGKSRVIIKIDALGQFAGVEVDENLVEKIPHLMA